MEILGIGPLEFLVILIIALIIFSPKDLAKGAKEAGRWINRLNRSDTWKSMRQVSQEMQNLPSRLAREAQLEDLKELEKDIQKAGDAQLAGLKEMEKNILPEESSPYRDRPSAPQMPPARPSPAPNAAPESAEPEPTPKEKDPGTP
jgi:Sec-independent protein translocase protein TatA